MARIGEPSTTVAVRVTDATIAKVGAVADALERSTGIRSDRSQIVRQALDLGLTTWALRLGVSPREAARPVETAPAPPAPESPRVKASNLRRAEAKRREREAAGCTCGPGHHRKACALAGKSRATAPTIPPPPGMTAGEASS